MSKKKVIINNINAKMSNHSRTMIHYNHHCDRCKLEVCPKSMRRIMELENEINRLNNIIDKLT